MPKNYFIKFYMNKNMEIIITACFVIDFNNFNSLFTVHVTMQTRGVCVCVCVRVCAHACICVCACMYGSSTGLSNKAEKTVNSIVLKLETFFKTAF